ncbi:MAG: DUF6456 domain-containing protein [Hyphomonadaceae bacterium]
MGRALSRLAQNESALLAHHAGGFAVFPSGDRRRKPLARLSDAEVRALTADGAIHAIAPDVFALTEAGQARVRREQAAPGDAFLEQHGSVVTRPVIDRRGAVVLSRGYAPSTALRRLAALRDQQGAPFLSADEMAAAARLRADWEFGQIGLVHGSDWSAPPMGAAARRPSGGGDGVAAAQVDARRRVDEALMALAAPLRRVVEAACLHETGIEAIEHAEGWPARSAKIALKLGLAQLAAYAAARASA